MEENLQNIDPEQLSWVPRLVYEYPYAGLLIYVLIVILSVIVYNLGFARKLPLLKKAIVYFALLFGCILLTVLAIFGAPIIEVLIISCAVLVIYKWRNKSTKSEEQKE